MNFVEAQSGALGSWNRDWLWATRAEEGVTGHLDAIQLGVANDDPTNRICPVKIDSFYTAFGYLTCEFAELEADLRVLIAGLSFGDNMVTAAVFLDSSQLAENTAMLRKLARQYDDYEVKMVEIARRIEKPRETRNLFIHGLWEPGGFRRHATERT